MDDLEKLNYALRAYAARQLPEPRGFEDLVRAGFLRSVPVPPPGKKYVIDVNTISVKLVDAQ